MSRFVLGLDLDGVCGDYEAAFRTYVARSLRVSEAELGPQTTWSFVGSGWPIRDEEHFRQLHADAVRRGMFRAMPAIEGASEALWRLSDAGVHIRIITHRLCVNGVHRTAAADTVEWLDVENLPYRDICFIADKPTVGADVYVDDAPHNIAALRAAGQQAIVFDQRYNQHVPGPRARSWAELADMVLALAAPKLAA